MKQYQQINDIVQSTHRLTVIPTKRYNTISSLFQQFGLKSGMSIYTWDKNQGLQTLEDDPLVIPDTQLAYNVLEFVQNSLHYAIYLLQDFPYVPVSKTAELFNNLLLSQTQINGKLILVGPQFSLDPALQEHTLFIDCGEPMYSAPEEALDIPNIPMYGAVASARR